MRATQVVAGRYRLEEVVGSGGMGTVWRATDQELGRMVALKRASLDDTDSTPGQHARRRLRREARIAAGLGHPHVVTTLDVVGDGAEWWLVMEYVPSRSLAEILHHQGRLEPLLVARLGAQVADALAAVHAKGVLHRDVKPGNVLVAEGGIAKLADFGISRTVHGDETLTQTGLVAGTPGFLAPEVANGQEAEAASDVFSLGATLFAAVEGTSPFGEVGNQLVALRRAAAGAVLPSRHAGPLAPVLQALLRHRPADRPDASDAARMLRDVAEGRPVRIADRQRGHRRLRVLAAAAVAVLLLTAGLVASRIGGSTPAPTAVPAVGDPRTADPCALTDQDALAQFGETRSIIDYGNFNRCGVGVQTGETEVEIKAELEEAEEEIPGPVEQVGRLRVHEPVQNEECVGYVLLPNRYQVTITPILREGVAPDLCAMATVATRSAAGVLRRGEIPRRPVPFDPESLALRKACALLDGDALAAVLGVGASRADPGFANWECRWESSSGAVSVRLIFDRSSPLSGDLVQIDGRDADIKLGSYGDGTCAVWVTHRPTSDGNGQPTAELLVVVVRGPQPPEQQCEQATVLAGAAAAKLSPP